MPCGIPAERGVTCAGPWGGPRGINMRQMDCFLFAGAVCLAAAAWGGECPRFLAPAQAGTPENAALIEASGLAASRDCPGVLWTHNDSGDGPKVYALTPQGRHLGVYTLSGVTAVDWEDMAAGPGPDISRDYLYIGDTGNNGLYRGTVKLHRVPEPVVDAGQAPVAETLEGVESFTLAYPLAPLVVYDCETLMVDPATGDVYLVSKDSSALDLGWSTVFRAAAPLVSGATIVLEEVASFYTGPGLMNQVTGGDIAPDGASLLIRTYQSVLWWPVSAGNVAAAFSQPPCLPPPPNEVQGETIAFAADGEGYYTLSEAFVLGVPQPVYFSRLVVEEPEGRPGCLNSYGGVFEAGGEFCLRLPDGIGGDAPYQWYHNGLPLVSDGRISGARSRSLSVLLLDADDSGEYTCAYETGGGKTAAVFGPVRVVVGAELPAHSGAGLALAAGLLVLSGAVALRRSSRGRICGRSMRGE